MTDARRPGPTGESPRELTAGAIILGVLFALVFAASSAYLALEVGVTVSASIPIAVLSATLLRAMSGVLGVRPATVLENNLVQTTGSAGASVAAGVAFTLPALLLLGHELPWVTVTAIGLVGGVLGVLMLVPVRRFFVVEEHAHLTFPEGTACAQVLVAGEAGGTEARTIFMGCGLGAAYKFMTAGLHMFRELPTRALAQPGRSAELTGIGFLIGPRAGGWLFAGGVMSSFVLIPAVKRFGAGLVVSDASLVNAPYFVGAGAITAAGVFSLARSFPALWASVRRMVSASEASSERDLSMHLVLGGVVACLAAMMFLPPIGIGIAGALLALLFARVFTIVSSRVTGQLGATVNPVSAMTVGTLVLTSLVFVAAGWVGREYRVVVLCIGGVVCVAAATAGAAAQSLRTGRLVGAAPRAQWACLLIGVAASALLVGGVIARMNGAMTTIVPRSYPAVQVSAIDPDGHYALANGRMVKGGGPYRIGHLYEQAGAASAGNYLIDDVGSIKYLVDPGLGGQYRTNYDGKVMDKLDSPKARLMALVVDGMGSRTLPWPLLLIGAALALVMEIVGMSTLPLAVGLYLPFATSAAIFMGGLIRWLAERGQRSDEGARADADPDGGVLFSSGLIAGAAITGIVLAGLATRHFNEGFGLSGAMGALGAGNLAPMIGYVVLLVVPLYVVARRVRSSTR